MTTDSNEQELLRRLVEHDRNAVESIYRNYYPVIQRLVVSNNGTSDDARDIFQEALIVLYDKARSGSFELQARLKTYLYAVSRKLWLKKLQRDRNFAADLNGAGETVSVEEDVERFEQRNKDFDLMEEALQKLGEPCRGLLESCYAQKRSMTDIARDFGYTNADNAKNQKYKCLMRLKKIFFGYYKKI
ncbi:MAG TPA: RNA polymerase sigma factor [Puia sp.]|nr:RNA polymerase sigma factor [Puia sp.]